ncbi:hypothetical protein [Actimicrobium antarcticum]
MNLFNLMRTVLGIRKARRVPPVSAKPQIGSSLVCNDFRVRLKYPLGDEQWEWLSIMGWRHVNMRSNRRRYQSLSDAVFRKLLDKDARDEAHQTIMQQAAVLSGK